MLDCVDIALAMSEFSDDVGVAVVPSLTEAIDPLPVPLDKRDDSLAVVLRNVLGLVLRVVLDYDW